MFERRADDENEDRSSTRKNCFTGLPAASQFKQILLYQTKSEMKNMTVGFELEQKCSLLNSNGGQSV